MSLFCNVDGCENYVEGKTLFCGIHNHQFRKEKRLSKVEKPKRKALRQQSPKRKEQNRVYSERVTTWKIGKKCAVRGCGQDCHDNHHMAGKEGVMLFNEQYWLPVCRPHHEQITRDSAWAIREGYSISRNKKAGETH